MRMGLTAALADLARTFIMEFIHKEDSRLRTALLGTNNTSL